MYSKFAIKYLILRVLLSFITILGIIAINIILINYIKVTPVDYTLTNIAKKDVNQAELNFIINNTNNNLIIDLKKHFGIDRPINEQIIVTIKNYLTFNLGKSFYYGKNVSTLIIEKIKVSFPILLSSTILTYIIAILLGLLKAKKHNTLLDKSISTMLLIFYGIPSILFALILIYLFSSYTILIAILINVFSGLLFITLLSKDLFLLEINSPHYYFALKRGVSGYNITKYYLLKPILIILFADLPNIFIGIFFGSSILVEVVLGINGIGLLGFDSLNNRDYAVSLALIYLISIIGITLRLLTDIAYAILNPRIKFKI